MNHVIFAAWTGINYTVTFNANGGTVDPANKVVTFDSTYGILPDPDRTGYTFSGWNASTNGVIFDVTASSIVAIPTDHTLTAVWVANTYTVTFDPTGGTVNSTNKPVTFDAVYGDLPIPARAGHTFRGWWTGDNGTGELITANMPVEATEDHTLFARWEQSFAGLYMVVDLSGGANAMNYTVSYLDSAPAGGWTDEHKTTKLVMRKIPAGTYSMGSPVSELGRISDETQHQVTLTTSFYIGVFEITQKQWELVMGTWPSYFCNASCRDARPVEQVSYDDIRGSGAGANWPTTNAVDAISFMGRLRTKTGNVFDLPTEARWEYACRAGTTTSLNSAHNLTSWYGDTYMAEVGRYWNNGGSAYTQQLGNVSVGSAKVGSYLSNSWGLYDMHGNVFEWCLDWYNTTYPGNVSDPKGAPGSTARVIRGGALTYYAAKCRSASRSNINAYARDIGIGFRVALSVYHLTVVSGTGGGDYAAGTDTAVAAAAPPPGWAFSSWMVSPDGTDLGTGFDSTQVSTTVTMPESDVTLTALYEANSYTVTFDPQGGTVDPAGKDVTFDALYGELPEPARTGHTFRGWWTAPGGTGELVAGSMKVAETENRTLYANWEQHSPGLYMVIDLFGGTNSESFPVTYLDAAPAGGWTDEHKATKLVMRKIPAGTFTMGSPEGELGRQSAETQHTVTLTKAFYIGVFEVTQRQWELVKGNRPSYFNNADYYQARPVESVSYYDIRENPANSDDPAADWPNNSAVNETSFMGRLRAKTELAAFDLPTEAQWEYACRAGTTTALNSGRDLTSTGSDPGMDVVGRYRYNGGSGYSQSCTPSAGTALAGSYLPNAWGLFDMHGNVYEWCLDWWPAGGLGTSAATDPLGTPSGSYRAGRGGSWFGYAENSRSAGPYYGWPQGRSGVLGFRAACAVPRPSLTVAGGAGDGEYEMFTPVSVEADESPAGYTFGHWDAAPEGVNLGTNFNGNLPSTTVTMPDRDVTLTAVLDANAYTVTFDPTGGSVDPTNKIVTFDALYGELPDPFRAGYTFAGWQTATNGVYFGVVSNTAVSIAADHTLAATWNANAYTVTFDPQGGSVSPASQTVTYDSAYGTLPDPSRNGYAFAGWRTAAGAAGTPVTSAMIVTTPSDHVLFAAWTEDPILCAPEGNEAVSSPGSYDGFLYGDAAFGDTAAASVRGTLTLKITDALKGKLTAKALTQTATLTFSFAQWTSTDADGIGHAALAARGGETLDLYVSQDRIWGSLTGGKIGAEVLAIDGARNRFSSRTDVDAQALLDTYRGYYTVALPAADTLSLGSANAAPSGSGYLTLTIGNGGSAKIAGVLADGTRVSKSSRLIPFDRCGPQACVPLFIPLYSKKGWAGGLLWIDPAGKTVMTDRYLGWFIRWEKPGSGPDGFRALLDTCGGYYSSLQPLAAHYLLTAGINAVPYRYAGGSADLQTAALPDGIGVAYQGGRLVITRGTRPALAGDAYDYTAENSAMATLSFASRTGIFKGKFSLYYDYTLNGRLIHKAVNAPYAGVLTPVRSADFAGQPAGQGYYLVPDNDPAVKAYKIKRSFPVWLDAAP